MGQLIILALLLVDVSCFVLEVDGMVTLYVIIINWNCVFNTSLLNQLHFSHNMSTL